jgi:hypothetical protein
MVVMIPKFLNNQLPACESGIILAAVPAPWDLLRLEK